MTDFAPQTSTHIHPTTGQITSGGAARNRCIAEVGGQDRVQKKAFEQGYIAGYAGGYEEGFEEGCAHGAQEAYNRVDRRLQIIENALLRSAK